MKIINGNVLLEDTFKKMDVYTSNGLITDELSNSDIIDASNMYVIPGFIDGHTHGRCGIDIMKASSKELSLLSQEYLKTGVTTVFPTVMTAPMDNLKSAINNIKNASTENGCDFVGIHVEGPYISKKKPGCHNIDCIRKPEINELKELIDMIFPLATRFTIAPEECDDGVIKEISKISLVSIGHTNCSLNQAYKAIYDGANSFTHTFNAMSPLTHRNPGCAGAALSSDIYSEFICDGLHVDNEILYASYKAKTKNGNKFSVITDSIPCAGLPYGDYEMNGIEFSLTEDGAKTKDGTLVGSTVSMLDSVKNLVFNCKIPMQDALYSATSVNADMLKLNDRGRIKIGQKADILILEKNLDIKHIIKNGKLVSK